MVGILLASYGACRSPAFADRLMMPPGWRITISDANDVIVRDDVLVATEFIVDREAINECNAVKESEQRLTLQLVETTSELNAAKKPKPLWHSVVWGALWGGSMVAAFILGTRI